MTALAENPIAAINAKMTPINFWRIERISLVMRNPLMIIAAKPGTQCPTLRHDDRTHCYKYRQES
jgi:hypothetical protein